MSARASAGMLLALGAFLLAAAPPATSPSAEELIHAWFDQLADPDALVRERAIENLMGLSRDELPLLKQVAADARPLLPSQEAVLHDIVSHVFMSGMKYPVEAPDVPFLGLSWDMVERTTPEATAGVYVTRRIPGFGAYRMLRDGDLITGIKERPGERFDNTRSFGDAIKSFSAGQTITLSVVRGGRPMSIPVQLRPKPLRLRDNTDLNPWLEERRAAADEYWEANFRSLVRDPELSCRWAPGATRA